jgi:hypothetical protein
VEGAGSEGMVLAEEGHCLHDGTDEAEGNYAYSRAAQENQLV